ncbi:MAG: HAD family hydrolase, partial [Candidatus Sifarchaeia archaeon]
MRLKAAVFDFDGTLVPFKMDYIALRQGVIRRIAKKGIQTENFKASDPIRVTLKKTREILNDKDMETLEREAEEIINFYELEGARNNSVITGVSEVLKTLKEEMNLKLAIFTLNQLRVVEILLNKANLFEIFDAIVTRNSVSDFYESFIKIK